MRALNGSQLHRFLAEAQDIAEAVLDAEVRMGELLKEIPKASGSRTDLQPPPTDGQRLDKSAELERIGIERHQAQRFEALASHPDLVAAAKAAILHPAICNFVRSILQIFTDHLL